ncbi:MAG: phosphodiesterase [Hyphomicrobiales bacterium]|nr:phosphodiesterase [Hyphomicrobiales bacterium]MDE2113602.1 phosphodiesterase [Hyphomicrobiales bacterium]
MLIAHLSDLHITGIDPETRRNQKASAAIKRVANLQPPADCLLISGDLVENGSREEYRFLHTQLQNLDLPIYVVLGNHDGRAHFREIFANYPGVAQSSGPVQYCIDQWPLQIIALDTLIEGRAEGQLTPESLDWLDSTLARAPHKPTLILMHHPPTAIGLDGLDAIRLNEGRERFTRIVAANPQIERILCGHVHRASHTRFAGTVVSTSSATGMQSHLDFSVNAKAVMIAEPACMQLHINLPDQGLVSHTAFIDDDFPKATLGAN